MDEQLKFISEDQEVFFKSISNLNEQKNKHKISVQDIIERYIITSLSDDQGYLVPNALSESQVNELESDLISLFSNQNLDNEIDKAIASVNLRLSTMDDLMISLGLDQAVLGDAVFEMETVQRQINEIADSYVVGAYGTEEYDGSIYRIRNAINRYRLDRNKPEFTLRSELMETLEVAGNAGANYANSHAVSITASIDRELKRVQANQAGIETGLYSGPLDNLTRPFCRKWVGQVMEYEFWDNLENNMPEGLFSEPASVYAGGINCRHRIVPWRLEWSDGKRDLRDRFAKIQSIVA